MVTFDAAPNRSHPMPSAHLRAACLPFVALALSLGRADAAQEPPQPPPRGSMTGIVQCAPTWVQLDDGRRLETPYPLARALEFAAPGAVIDLLPGEYPPLQIGFANQDPANARTAGGSKGLPVVVRGRGGVTITPQGRGDTIGINNQIASSHIRFENLTIAAGSRSAVMFYDLANDRRHEGFHFIDCTIDGGWNHLGGGGGTSSKWGVLGHDLADFVFAGRDRRAVVRDVRLEHAFYLQSPRGDITIENVDAKRLGRCFVQITARARSGPPGRGLIRIRNNVVADTGLSDWDNYKGGTAFTFAGGLRHCTILVERNTYRAGFEPELRRLTAPGVPYGTGALVAWDGGEAQPNGFLILRGNDFRFAEGCGDRPVVAIGACERVVVEADNVFVAGAFGVALDVEPQVVGERSGTRLNGRVLIAAGVELEGELRIASTPATAAQRAALAVPFGER